MPILWIDIETLPSINKIDPSTLTPPANYTKRETIDKWREENAEKAWRGQALESLYGRVCCVAWAEGNAPVVCRGIWDKKEKEIFEELNEVVQAIYSDTRSQVRWGGFNIKSFDLNWIWHRAIKYDLAALADNIQRDRYPKNVLDVRDFWTGGDPYGKGKLKEIATFFGFKTIEGMEGGDVLDRYIAGEYEEIEKYCSLDVELTRNIAKRMTNEKYT